MKEGPTWSKVQPGLKERTWIKRTCQIPSLWDHKECCYHEQKGLIRGSNFWRENQVHFRHTEYEVMIGHSRGKRVYVCLCVYTLNHIKTYPAPYHLCLLDIFSNHCCTSTIWDAGCVFHCFYYLTNTPGLQTYVIKSLCGTQIKFLGILMLQEKYHSLFFWMILSFKRTSQAYIMSIRSKGTERKTLPALGAGICYTKPPVMPAANWTGLLVFFFSPCFFPPLWHVL